MVASDAAAAESNSTVADITGPRNHTGGDKSATQGDNQHTPHVNPTLNPLDNIAASEGYEARQTILQSAPQNTRRFHSRKVSITTLEALTAEIKAEIRVKFKLSDVTFEQIPLAKTLAVAQILKKLANRTVKLAKQDVDFNELCSQSPQLHPLLRRHQAIAQ